MIKGLIEGLKGLLKSRLFWLSMSIIIPISVLSLSTIINGSYGIVDGYGIMIVAGLLSVVGFWYTFKKHS